MSFQYLPIDESYHELRRFLLSQTFFTARIIPHLRQQIGIPIKGFKSDEEILAWQKEKGVLNHPDNFPLEKGFGRKSERRLYLERTALLNERRRELFKPIYKEIERFPHLELEFQFFKWLTLGYKRLHFEDISILEDNQIYNVTSSNDPIVEVGTYIKFSPYLSDKELLALKKSAETTYKRLNNYEKTSKKTISRKDIQSPTKVGDYYLNVEQACIDAYYDDPNKFNRYFKLDMIFKFVSQELHVNDSLVRNNYYRIQNRYNLPSITEASKIPNF